MRRLPTHGTVFVVIIYRSSKAIRALLLVMGDLKPLLFVAEKRIISASQAVKRNLRLELSLLD